MSLLEVLRREEYVAAGLLRKDVTDDGLLAIYNYTDKTTFSRAWDDITINSRGHIFNVMTGERVAWAMPKFFNLGEAEEVAAETFDWTSVHHFYEKLDGCLGILYRHRGQHYVASRGSFHSDHSQWASAHIAKYNLSALPDEVTLCFEMITPKLRVIISYGDKNTLVILSAFNRHTGVEYQRNQVEAWGRQLAIPVVARHHGMTIQAARDAQASATGMEGFVVHFTSGQRVKVKTDWYMNLSRLYSRLSPITTWEAMVDGRVAECYLAQYPDELQPLACDYAKALEGQYAKVKGATIAECQSFIARHDGDPKAMGLNLDALSSVARKAVFAVLRADTAKLNRVVMDAIYPRSNEMAVV